MAVIPKLTEHMKYASSLNERMIIKRFIEAAESAEIWLAYYGADGSRATLERVKKSNDELISEHLGINEEQLATEKELCVAFVKGGK